MNYKGKKLLLLCGNVIHVKVVETAKRMGVYTIVTDHLPLESAPAKKMADEALFINVYDVDQIVEYCRENHVDGVLNFCNDHGQLPHQQICERLNLPCYGNKEQFHILTDKRAFKDMCRQYGLDVIPGYTEAEAEAGDMEYPVLIKPAISRGSRGQAVCHTKEEVPAALAAAKAESNNGMALIEKYMGGKQDFTMSFVFKDGDAYLLRTCDRHLGLVEDGLEKQCICSVSPSTHTDMYLKNVNERVITALKGIGLKNAVAFMQGFVDGDTVRFYDPGLRLSGTDYENVLRDATGFDMMEQMIAFALGGEINTYDGALKNAYQLCGKVSVQLLVAARAGTIARFEGLEEIRQNPHVVSVAARYSVGETVPSTGDVRQRVCEIVIMAEPDNAQEVVEWVQSKLILEDTEGKNMLVSQFDSSKVKRNAD